MTIGILSWGAPQTLRNTLESYRRFGLDQLDDDKYIFFQEITEEDNKIAKEFGYTPYGSTINIGIAEAYKQMVENADGEYFLFLENDWELVEDAKGRIIAGQTLLQRAHADVVRYRSRSNPGAPLWTLQFAFREHERPSHMLDAVHWGNDNHLTRNLGFEEFSVISKETEWKPEPFWITGANKANWTNNPHMAKTDFLRKSVLPRIEGDIEISIQDWWQQQPFRVAMGEGLFTHNRLDR